LYADDNCVKCHGDEEKMKGLGYPKFIMRQSEVESQTRMPASCTDCHKGDPDAEKKEEAHAGLLTLTILGTDWTPFKRSTMPALHLKDWTNIEPRGGSRATSLAPKIMREGKLTDNKSYKTIIWHDRNPATLAFSPAIAGQTCGKCHGKIVKSFLKTPMGGARGAHTQSQYRAWTGLTGPQSCGLWMASPVEPDRNSFDNKHIAEFNKHSTHSITEKVAHNSQRTCNQCHVGCLDCHYSPSKVTGYNKGLGPHTFTKRPESLSCYGGGKSFGCHAGPLERRRGDGYIRGEFTQAAQSGIDALKENKDIHLQRNINCVDCHEPNKKTKQHGDLKRTPDCSKCHAPIVSGYSKNVHKKVDCASCHTTLIGGYAFNFWTLTGEGDMANPITRIQDYTVNGITPLLVKSEKGIWIPVHPVPHTSGNIKAEEVKLSSRLNFRNIPFVRIQRRYTSADSFAVTGIVQKLDESDNDTMVWLNLDRVAHATGKSRTCESCHSSTTQRIKVGFEGGSYKGLEDGEYTIIADEDSLRIVDFKMSGDGSVPGDLEPLKDKWELKGNYSLPAIKNRKLYDSMKANYDKGKFLH